MLSSGGEGYPRGGLAVRKALRARWWATKQKITPFELGENAVGRNKIEAEGAILHYQENLVWGENYFPDIMENQDEFRSAQIRQFSETYNVSANNFDVEFDEETKSTVLKCDVHGQLKGNWYDFHWFLNPLGLDFIESDFVKSEGELFWERSINGALTTITLSFPFSIDHCHAHVWPK